MQGLFHVASCRSSHICAVDDVGLISCPNYTAFHTPEQAFAVPRASKIDTSKGKMHLRGITCCSPVAVYPQEMVGRVLGNPGPLKISEAQPMQGFSSAVSLAAIPRTKG